MPEPFPSLAHAGLGLALGLGLLYLILRGTAWRPGGGDPVRAVRVHAMVTALIALFASGTSGYQRLATLDGLTGRAEPLGGLDTLATVSGPVLGLSLVYIVAQYTWPRQTGAVRTARLADRRTLRYLPRKLSAVAIGVLLLSTAAIALEWTSPPVEMMQVTGYRPGRDVAPWLLAALVMITAGFLVVLRVVARRPPLGGLHPHDDHLVRQITVNRALRTTVLMLWGVGNTAFQAWVAAHHALADRALGPGPGASPELPPAVDVLTPITGVTSLVLMLAMLLWRSPALRQLGDHTVTDPVPASSERTLGRPGTVEAVRRLRRESITVAWTFAVIVAVVTAGPMLSSAVEAHLVWAGLPFAAVLSAFGLYEFAIRRGHCLSSRVSPPFSGTTPRWAWWALGVSLALTAAWCVLSPSISLAAITGALALGSVVLTRVALRRPPLGRATEAEDEAIRSSGAERILAVGAAGITLVTATACIVTDHVWPGVGLAGLAVVCLLGPVGRAVSTQTQEPVELPVHR